MEWIEGNFYSNIKLGQQKKKNDSKSCAVCIGESLVMTEYKKIIWYCKIAITMIWVLFYLKKGSKGLGGFGPLVKEGGFHIFVASDWIKRAFERR